MNAITFDRPVRVLSMAILVFFAIAVLLGFSMAIDLRLARGFWVIDPTLIATTIAEWAKDHIWEFVKAVAKAALLAILAGIVIKMMQKLESIHVVRNFLLYSDALGFDKYIGTGLNKLFAGFGDNPNEAESNVAAMAAKAATTLNLSPKQIEQLALAGSGPPQITEFKFYAYKNAKEETSVTVNKGESVSFVYSVKGENILGLFEDQDVQLPGSGSKTLTFDQSTKVNFGIYDKVGNALQSKQVDVKVSGTTAYKPPKNVPPPKSSNTGGLDQAQVNQLMRGTLATVISQSSCGGANTRLIRNMAIYNSTRVRGFDPRSIDPSSGNFYTDMYRLGNPFASPDFQELAMRDAAASIEAQARMAVNQELTGSGQKALRSEKNGITRSSQTISESITQSLNQAFRLSANAPEHPAATAVGMLIGQMIVQLIFNSNQNSRLVAERAVCQIGQLAASDVYSGATGDLNPGQVAIGEITVNGKDVAQVKKGERATLAWNVPDNGDITAVEVTPLPRVSVPFAPCRQGAFQSSCTFTAVENQTFTMTVTSKTAGKLQKIASLVVEEPPPPPAPGDIPPPADDGGF